MNEWNEMRAWLIDINTKRHKSKLEAEMCLAITPQIRRALQERTPNWNVLNETLWNHILIKFPKLNEKRNLGWM